MRDYIKEIKTYLENHRYDEVQRVYDNLNKFLEKKKNIIFEKETPRYYIRILSQLRKIIKETPAEKLRENKKIKDSHQKLKKFILIKCKEFADDIAKFEEAPVPTTEEEENNQKRKASGSDSSSSDGSKKSDSNSDSSNSDSDTSSIASVEDKKKVDRTKLPPEVTKPK